MATRSRIGKQLEDGSIKFIYCHWDGYPEHNGVILKEHYTTDAKVDELLALGDLSILGEEIGEQQDFDILSTHNDKWCLAYGRDRGQDPEEIKAIVVGSLEEMIEEEYHYVWNNGKWHCYGGDGRELVF